MVVVACPETFLWAKRAFLGARGYIDWSYLKGGTHWSRRTQDRRCFVAVFRMLGWPWRVNKAAHPSRQLSRGVDKPLDKYLYLALAQAGSAGRRVI
jgi:hypothetical protein